MGIYSLMLLRNKAIIETAKRYNSKTGFYDDMAGLGKIAFPGNPQDEQLDDIATFILSNQQMWHQVGNTDPKRQDKKWRYPLFRPEHITPDENLEEYIFARVEGLHPLFADAGHKYLNVDLGPLDFLYTIKEDMKELATGMHTGSPEGDWFNMQNEFAKMIRSCLEIPAHRISLMDIYHDRIK